MSVDGMTPHGLALEAYLAGDAEAELVLLRDDGEAGRIPVSLFFRPPAAFTALENAALERCRGLVLDVGAGSGLHSLVLQERGFRVTAIDVSPHAVAVMSRRGVTDVREADLFELEGGPFDTLLMLGHGIGMVETTAGLDRFLARAPALLAKDGQILVDSLDVRRTADPKNLAYQEANRRAGRYIGEIRMRFEFRGVQGASCGWLHVDAGTLAAHATGRDLACAVLLEDDHGNYLARLTRRTAA